MGGSVYNAVNDSKKYNDKDGNNDRIKNITKDFK
jgi:hypothetical protein